MSQEAEVRVIVRDGYSNVAEYNFSIPLSTPVEASVEPHIQTENLESCLMEAINETRRVQGKAALDPNPKPPARQPASQAKPRRTTNNQGPGARKRPAAKRKRPTGPGRAVKDK